VWLKTSWLIMLFGAEIAFAHQYVDTYELEPDCLKISPAFKGLITLGVVHLSVEAFKKGDPPPRASEISQKLETPIRLINQILYELVEARVLSEVKIDEERIVGYQPARDIDEMTVGSVMEQLNDHGTDRIPVSLTPQMEKISGALKEIRDLLKNSSTNLKIADL
jgi:membrane protein